MRELNGVTECEVSGTVCPAQRGHPIVDGTVVWEVAVGSLPSFVSVDRKNPFPLSSFLYSLKRKTALFMFCQNTNRISGVQQPLQLILYPTLSLSAQTNTYSNHLSSGFHLDGLMCKTEDCSEVSPNPNPKSKIDLLFSAISHIIPPPLGNGPVPPPPLPILSGLLARERQREPSCLQCARASLPMQNEISPFPYFSPALSCPSPSLPFSLTAPVWDLDSASLKGSLLHSLFSEFLGCFSYLLWNLL